MIYKVNSPIVYKANSPMDIDNSPNVRELGGYINEDGMKLKKHKILRAGDLSLLTETEIQKLEKYGIKSCIDLRISSEREQEDPFSRSDSLIYHSIPINGEINTSCAPSEILYELYKNILDKNGNLILRIMQIIAMESEGIIVHCTAGKDRTGVVAMLILSICDVCEEQIVADYIVSGGNNIEQTKAQKMQLEKMGIKDIPDELFDSVAETIEKTIKYLNEKYYGPINYLRSIGLYDWQIERIKIKMLGD